MATGSSQGSLFLVPPQNALRGGAPRSPRPRCRVSARTKQACKTRVMRAGMRKSKICHVRRVQLPENRDTVATTQSLPRGRFRFARSIFPRTGASGRVGSVRHSVATMAPDGGELEALGKRLEKPPTSKEALCKLLKARQLGWYLALCVNRLLSAVLTDGVPFLRASPRH